MDTATSPETVQALDETPAVVDIAADDPEVIFQEDVQQTLAWLNALLSVVPSQLAWFHGAQQLRREVAKGLVSASQTNDMAADAALRALARGNITPLLEYRRTLRQIVEAEGRSVAGLLRECAALASADEALVRLQEVTDRYPDELLNWHLLGDVAVWCHEHELAELAYRTCLQRILVGAEGGDLTVLHQSSVLLEGMGDMQREQGDWHGAEQSYLQALAVVERLLLGAPEREAWQHDWSVLQEKLGELGQLQGDLSSALVAYQRYANAAERLSMQMENNLYWRRDWAIALEKIAEIMQARGNTAEALPVYMRSLAMLEALIVEAPEQMLWQHDLSVLYDRVGGLKVRQGLLAEAEEMCRKSLALRGELVQRVPANLEWQRDLSVCYDEIGDVQQVTGQLKDALGSFYKGLSVAEALVTQAPTRLDWQRDLLVSCEKIGEVQQSEGQFEAALEMYHKALAIAEKLTQTQPDNVMWQRDLSVVLEKLGDVQRSLGRGAEAKRTYQHSFHLIERLVRLDVSNVTWRVHLAVTYWKMAQVTRGGEAYNYLHDGLRILQRLDSDGSLTSAQQEWIVAFRRAMMSNVNASSSFAHLRPWRRVVAAQSSVRKPARRGGC